VSYFTDEKLNNITDVIGRQKDMLYR